jgi:N-dimethylarginine dimethylaminohydrolase
MCPPDYYGIEYEINPWMDIRRQADLNQAKRQWQDLYDLLKDHLGARIELIKPVKGLPDMVFTANAGLIHKRQFIVANMTHSQRRGESPHFHRWFEEKDYQVHLLPQDHLFEGAGDGLFFGDNLFAGYRIRSDVHAHRMISQILNVRVLSLELVDERFYHLDTCFCPLDEERVLYYPMAFDEYGLKVIEQFVPKPLPINRADALKFGCNAVVVQRQVVLHHECEELKTLLRREGFKVYELDLSEFLKAGGSAKCLTLRVD